MHLNLRLYLTALFFFLLTPGALAQTPVTGEAHAKVFGIMSMDVSDPGVSIKDLNSPDCDKVKKICYMDGFSWSDVIGWTAWEGGAIAKEVQKNGGIFPEDFFSKVTFKGSLSGFIWGEKTGWVQLSDCNSTDNQPACVAKPYCQWTGANACDIKPDAKLPEVSTQTATSWGAYIDFCALKSTQAVCESATSDPYCNWDIIDNSCTFDAPNNPKGEPVRGYAWSQYLGWIKFGVEPGDTGFEGVYTNWFADLTPPKIKGLLGNAWIPNTTPTGTIDWTDFAEEKESKLNFATSQIEYTLDAAPGYIGCTPGGKANITQNQGAVNLSFPGAGVVSELVDNHHCKYELKGVLYNEYDYGYFFGADAKIRAAAAGVDVNDPAPNIIDEKNAYLYTLAGKFDAQASSLTSDNTAVADGIEALSTTFSPRDVAGNPVVTIPFRLDGTPTGDPNQAVKNLYMAYDLDAADYVFDSVNVLNNILVPAPVRIETTYYNYPHDKISFPASGPADVDYSYFLGDYKFSLHGLAPTGKQNKLSLTDIQLETNTQAGVAALPAVSPSMPAVDMAIKQSVDEKSTLGGGSLPHLYTFEPALEVTKGELNTDFIVIGQSVLASYELTNKSNNLKLIDYALDHVIDFTNISGNIGKEVLEIKNINLNGLADVTGRTDPDSGLTRYQTLHDTSGLADLQFNEFHSNIGQFHDPNYNFVFDTVDNQGEYDVDGAYYASPEDPGPYAPVTVDRTDALDFDMEQGSTGAYDFKLTPSQYIGDAMDAKVEMGIKQYVAYHGQDAILSQFAIYQAPDHISGIEVKSIGLGTPGVVSGGQIFETVGGRDLNNITLTSSAELRKEVRRNVAQLIRNMDLTNCDASAHPLTSLPTSASDCVVVDEVNKTIMAVYRDSTLSLGGAGDMVVPAGYKFSLILVNGANLYLKDNLTYNGLNNNSMGIILLQNEAGKGANVYLHPKPTNMVGLLYAEGSILSSPDGGATFYYGAGANSAELRNQLYWQGSIASRNTIGGSPNKILPAGVDCSPWPNVESCSQAFDLDFTRRFAVLHDEDENVDYAGAGFVFSGGGSCNNPPGISCSAGSLPSTVNLSGPNSTINLLKSKSLDTFFIQRDNRLVPLGFTSNNGLSSSSEIR